MNIKSIIFIALLILFFTNANCYAKNENHPRIYSGNTSNVDFLKAANNVEWKKQLIQRKKENLEKYIEKCKDEPEWLVSRLQMNWKTKHSKVFLHGGKFSHSSGKAPVPTVRFSGTRDWATDYRTPSIEEVEPYFDDERGMYLKHKKTDKKEWVHPSKVGFAIEGVNRKIMALVEDAAFLYWLTGEKKYAQFAEPVFLKYIEGMYYRDAPVDLDNSNQQRISGLSTFEVIHDKIVVSLSLVYDFLHPYLLKNNRDLDHTYAVFQKWGDQIIKNGIPDNNWNLFQANILTHIALALDENKNYANGKGQEYYLKYTFDQSTERQWSIKEAVNGYDQKTGIWPESSSYSLHVTSSLLHILTLLDNSTNKNELANFPILEKAALAAFQYLFPSGYTVAFGDAHHGVIPPENFELLISNYRKYNNKDKELVITGLLKQLIEKGEYIRKGKDLFDLFFYTDQLLETDAAKTKELSKKLITPTFYAPNVSMFIQRMGEDDQAMMVSTVGTFGNHSHVNGISMELYANNYVLGPDMSKGPSYWHTDHREYYSQFPAHNTVVVDGVSSYGRMRGYHPFTLDNHFPIAGESKVDFDKVSFSNVSFMEPQTLSDQQRLTAMIKSPAGKGYIVDVFRSRKKDNSNQKHEYFYHNLGQSLVLFDGNDQPLTLHATDELGTSHGDMIAYDYLTDKKEVVTPENINALFTLKSKGQADNLMKMWIKGAKEQTVFTALSPKSNALTKGTAPVEMLGQKIPTLILRRETEAWRNPFAVVFNPHMHGEFNSVLAVNYLELKESPDAEKIRITHKDGKTKDMIVANASQNDIALDEGFYQKGLLSVIRQLDSEKMPTFLFLSGMYKFDYKDWGILSYAEAVCISIERTEEGYVIQNDNPVAVKIPSYEGHKPSQLLLYENGKIMAQKDIFVNRNNPNQVDFRLEKAYQKVVVVLDK
ncbi:MULTISPECIES: heparinase II/III domain-containing protein [unclassified Saccharicrinis]|uniref:heparinase II/III domain-containing protein n=1 Tax=unclassified Saccharicrinis TaxID=2646859 RepID=UPI003D349D06